MGLDRAQTSSKSIAKISGSLGSSTGDRDTASPKRNALAELSAKNGAADILTSLREKLSSLEARHRERLLENAAKIYEVATFLREDGDAWLEFCRHSEWEGFRNSPKNTEQSDALRYSLRMAVGFGDDLESKRAATKRANKFYGALQPFFSQRVPPSKIVDEIKKGGGFENLKRDNAATRRGEDKPSEKQETLLLRIPLTLESRGLLKERPPERRMGVIFKVLAVKGKAIHIDFERYGKMREQPADHNDTACNTLITAKKPKPSQTADNDRNSVKTTKKGYTTRNMKEH